MGFGIVWIGYAVTYLMAWNSYDFLFRLTGAVLLIEGTRRLSAFDGKFRPVYGLSFAMAADSLIEAILFLLPQVASVPYVFDGSTAKIVTDLLFWGLSAAFHVGLFRAIGSLARTVENEVLAKRARYGVVYLAGEVTLVACTYVCYALRLHLVNVLFAASVFLWFVFILVTLVLLYGCYKDICEEGDEEAPRKPSRIPFLNTLFEAQEKREQDIYEKTKAYVASKQKPKTTKRKRK